MLVTPYQPEWKEQVQYLLRTLPDLYPDFKPWLERRLDSVEDTLVYTVWEEEVLAGVVIGVQKDENRFKISTIFVEPEYRGKGIGEDLLDHVIEQALFLGNSYLYLTADSSFDSSLGELLRLKGFSLAKEMDDLYGAGRTEHLYERFCHL